MKINKELMKGSTSILILSLLEKRAMYGYLIGLTQTTGSAENIIRLRRWAKSC